MLLPSLVFIAAAWRFHASRPVLTGVCLALCALKFHLFLLVPLMLIAQRKWRVMAWATAGVLVLLGISPAVSTDRWIPRFIEFALDAKANMHSYAMPNLAALFTGLPHALAWEFTAGAFVAAIVAWLSWRSSFTLALSATLVGGLLVSHHAYISDMLLPVLVFILREAARPTLRLLAGFLLSPLPFLIYPKVPFSAPLPLLLVLLLIGLLLDPYAAEKKTAPARLEGVPRSGSFQRLSFLRLCPAPLNLTL